MEDQAEIDRGLHISDVEPADVHHLAHCGIGGDLAIELRMARLGEKVRDAHVREFECTLIEDGCAAFSEDVHGAAVDGLRPVARIATVAEVIAALAKN